MKSGEDGGGGPFTRLSINAGGRGVGSLDKSDGYSLYSTVDGVGVEVKLLGMGLPSRRSRSKLRKLRLADILGVTGDAGDGDEKKSAVNDRVGFLEMESPLDEILGPIGLAGRDVNGEPKKALVFEEELGIGLAGAGDIEGEGNSGSRSAKACPRGIGEASLRKIIVVVVVKADELASPSMMTDEE